MRSCIFVVLAVVGANVVASSESEIKLICDKARQSVAIVETTAGTGSGFVTQFQDGKKYFVTNRHVVENASKVTAVAIDGGEVLLGRFQYASNDFDLVRFAVSSDAKALEMASCVPSFGDALFVVGNSDGVGVATCIEGKLRGIGADRFELSAKFICGNSGSPVLNSRGQVVGVATYALLHNDPENWLLQDSSFNAVRRFGLRLDGVKWISDDFEAFCAKQKIKREEEAKAKEMSIAQRQMATLDNYLREYMHASREEQTPEEVLQAVRKTKGSYCQFTDRWGVDYKFSIVSNTAYLASAGIDRTFETPDDIVLTNNCAFPVGVLSLEARREEEKYQRQISSAREIARAIKCVTGLSLREHCDLHQVECDRVKIGHIEFLTSGYRRCGQQTLFNAVFPVCKVSFTAKSGLVFAIQLRTGKTVPRVQYDEILRQVEGFVGEKFIAGSEMFGIEAGCSFPDNTHLSVAYTDDGFVECGYMCTALFQQVTCQGFEANSEEINLASFLGVKMGDEFWNIMKRLSKLDKGNGYATASYGPERKFLDFDDYKVRFSTKSGQIVMVSCSKVIKRDEHMMDEACKIVSILERKYGKIAHRSVSPDPECPGAWEIDFYDSVPTRYEGVNEYELKRFISVMLVPVKGYESRAVTLAIVAQAMDLQSGDIERSLDDPINAL